MRVTLSHRQSSGMVEMQHWFAKLRSDDPAILQTLSALRTVR